VTHRSLILDTLKLLLLREDKSSLNILKAYNSKLYKVPSIFFQLLSHFLQIPFSVASINGYPVHLLLNPPEDSKQKRDSPSLLTHKHPLKLIELARAYFQTVVTHPRARARARAKARGVRPTLPRSLMISPPTPIMTRIRTSNALGLTEYLMSLRKN
jgi:hypothetical protein